MRLRSGRAGLAEWVASVADAGDRATLVSADGDAADNIEESGLDVRTHALVRLAALVAAAESGTIFDEHVAAALDHGVTLDEIVGVLVALLPAEGPARIAAMAPAVLRAIDRASTDVPAPPD